MMIVKDPVWNTNGDHGRGDSIGRSLDAFRIWGDYRFIEGIESCWVKVKNKGIRRLFRKWHWQGYRYPTYANGTEINSGDKLSRDHLKNTVIAYKYAGKTDKEMWDFVKRLRWRISDFARFTPELWLFCRMLAGRKISTWLYPRVTYVVKRVTVWLQLKVEKKLGFGPHYEENQDTFHHIQNDYKPACIKPLSKLLHPIFALQQDAEQSTFIKSDKWRKRIQDQIYRITPTYNHVIKLLIDHPEDVSYEDVVSYKPMTGGRWGGILNIWWNNRCLEIVKDPKLVEYNVMDVDYLKYLWNGKFPELPIN
jgi:hypothetical protein